MNNFFYTKMRKLRYVCAGLIVQSFFCLLYAQVHMSSHPHSGALTAAVQMPQSSRDSDNHFLPVFTAGEDGFIIKWTDIESGEHFQFSDNQIKLMAVHPNGKEIAIYETDGFALNRLSVWDWHSQKRKFAKRLNAPPASLNYSAKGNYVLVGMSNMDGILCFNAQNGELVQHKIKEQAAAVGFALTSPSENTCIMYSALGSLIYTDLRSGKQKARFSIEQNLHQNCLFYNNILFAGVKNGSIYVFRSDTGEKAAFVPEKKALLCTSVSDTNLYYLDISGKNLYLKMLEVENGYIKQSPQIVKTFFLPQKEVPVLAIKNGNNIYIGTKNGQLYTLSAEADSQITQAMQISKRIYDKICDIARKENFFYFLTEKMLFKASYEEGTVYSLFSGINQTNMEPYRDNLILWSKNTKKSVQLVSEGKPAKTLFTPAQPLQVLHVYYDKLVMIEGNTKVKIYDLQTGTMTQPYNGTGIQDVLLYTPEQLYAAKSSAAHPKTPLIQIDPSTKETTALMDGIDIMFSLSQDDSKKGPVYGVSLTAASSAGKTEIFAFFPETKQYKTIFKWADEDNNAFTWVKNGTLFTNIGKTQIHAYNIAENKDTLLERTASLPVKITGTDSVLAVLNKDGSISWYDADTKQLYKNWYITVDGEWLEF
ncbi:WD40 repeat domain-containing protein [Treponema sp. OMZ 840]|uniref:hypothetical protein n=1 Tax=Treponema sp. OMZ 840 TaxID=244313 RepID=UPI003D914BE1